MNNEDIKNSSPKKRILLVATDLFYKEGIRATGIDKIIKCSNVTKVTFYRHYPSKKDLILAYLDFRHTLWIDWFEFKLNYYLKSEKILSKALVSTFKEWFVDEQYNGCSFINSTAELGVTYPEILQISKNHKRTLATVISKYLPAKYMNQALPVVMAIDGMIVHVQMGEELKEVINSFEIILQSLLS